MQRRSELPLSAYGVGVHLKLTQGFHLKLTQTPNKIYFNNLPQEKFAAW